MRQFSPNGLLSALIDANGNKTQFTFDGLDRLYRKIYADDSFEENTLYDENSNLLTFTTSSGKTIESTFDELDRLITRTPEDQPTVTLSYDLHGRVLTASKPTVGGDPSSGELAFGYDSAGRFVSEEYPDSKTVSHELDANGNRTKTTWPDGYYANFVFDELNRLTDVKLNGSMSSAVHTDFDALSRKKKITYENGVKTNFAYEPDDDLSAIGMVFSPSEQLAFSYQYNKAHEITAQSVSDADFLKHPSPEQATDYITNNLNQYTSVGRDDLSYDGNGNLIERADDSYTFNTENQLASLTSGTATVDFKFDPLGRRVVLDETGESNLRLLYSGVFNVAEYDNDSGDLIKRHIFAGDMFTPLLDVDAGTGDVTFWHQDQLGSVVAGTDDTGTPALKYAYLPFGEATKVDGAADSSFGFASMFKHSRSGLNLTLYRAYSAPLGRWLSRDPIGESMGINLYAYVGNSPINAVDPLGLLVQVGYRSASGPFQHMVLILTPDTPQDFQSSNLFQNNMATLSGEPAIPNQPFWGPYGKLIKKANDPPDAPCNLHDTTEIATPPGMTDTEFINAMIQAFNSYSNNAPYNPFYPKGIDNANSNNLVSGLVKAGGGFIPINPETGRGPLNAPGGTKPMNLPYIPPSKR